MIYNKQTIMTIDAKKLFDYFPKKEDEQGKPFCFNTEKRNLFTMVVKVEAALEECPLLDQFMEVLKEDNNTVFGSNPDNKLLYDKLVIIDFGDIFLPSEDENVRIRKEMQRRNVQDMMTNGLDLCYDGKVAHLKPFDKSNSMSRNSRITFIAEHYIDEMNKRLNLGMDFTQIKVVLSKYYAYKGLYLSTSRRVRHEQFQLTQETVVIVKDQRMKKKKNGEETPVLGPFFERNVPIETAVAGESPDKWNFQKSEIEEIVYPDNPFDGMGLITPLYSKYINDILKMQGATSYQIRLPFAKGMVHEVNVAEFLKEYTSDWSDEEEYWYEDPFGIKRDLRKAQILLTESMFKGIKWLKEHCRKNAINDPMKYYCDKIKEYNHGFYVSGTNLPYGHTKYTHLTYQWINTLDFDDEQFERIITGHGNFIRNPIEFLRGWDEADVEDSTNGEDDLTDYRPNWKRAVLKNESFAKDIYIQGQLDNIEKSLITKIALGKILVEGQTRYLCRDLLPLLVSLLRNESDISVFYMRYIYQRFYIPQGNVYSEEQIKLDYKEYYAFFRNPHLSRNEQYLMRPFTVPKSEKEYVPIREMSYDFYQHYISIYRKYFGHLTGIVMVPRGSVLPVCLGGADFDGDLVSVIFNQDVIDAVKKGAYEKDGYWLKRKASVVKIPGTSANECTVPPEVPYEHIEDTFSNRIGQISNAAITIGQREYGANSQGQSEYSTDQATCAKCTMLTGLEIDAAKNGIHPNLDLILKEGKETCSYLKFINKYKKLKSHKNFSFAEMRMKKENKDGAEKIVVTAKKCNDTEASFPITNQGTYINQLPEYFYQYYNGWRKKKKTENESLLNCKSASEDNNTDTVNELKEACDAVINLHFFYKRTVLKALREEKTKDSKASENIGKMINWMYDENYAEKTESEILPSLREKIEPFVANKVSAKEIKTRINKIQWQFQPYNKRGKALEEIIGNGFKESLLSDEEKSFLFHFHQQGYKLLWLLIDLIDEANVPTYAEVSKKFEDKRKKYAKDKLTTLEEALETEMKQYYENNAANTEQMIYLKCLNELKNVIGCYSDRLNISTIVAAVDEETRYDKNRRRFFWEVFSWNELEPFIGGKKVK